MRIVPTLLLGLILLAGSPLSVSLAEPGAACAVPAAVDDSAGNPCNPSNDGVGIGCGVAGGSCQLPAVGSLDMPLPAPVTAAPDHLLPASPYRSPDLLGLYRPPIARRV